VALLIGEPAAAPVAAILRDPDDPSVLSAVNLAEVVDVLVRLRARPFDEVAEKLDWLAAGGLEAVAADESVGRMAGRMRAEHYDRRLRPISLADCVALATARALDEPLATSDPVLIEVARSERCAVIGLPDSAGRLPD
jgi:predicted nucleic acid-binding protein